MAGRLLEKKYIRRRMQLIEGFLCYCARCLKNCLSAFFYQSKRNLDHNTCNGVQNLIIALKLPPVGRGL